MITFRSGRREDYKLVANLHAESWKASYRGIVSDHYLDHEVEQERFDTWKAIMEKDDPNLHLIIVEKGQKACGFAGIYLNRSRHWGSYIDNLHVLKPHQGRGIGAQLMRRSADWIHLNSSDRRFYLWVYTANLKARTFYEKMRCQYKDTKMVENPGGGKAEIIRCVWDESNPIDQFAM